MQSHSPCFSSRTEICVDRTEKGIREVVTLDGIGSEPTEEAEEDSIFDENLESLALERRDFDDIEGIEFDLDLAYYRDISFRPCDADDYTHLNHFDKNYIRRDTTS